MHSPTPRDLVSGLLAALLLVGSIAGCSRIDDPTLEPSDTARFEAPTRPLRNESPSAERHVFFGDLHIHSSYSYDAYTMGTRALPDDAYRFAKGETIEHALGYPIRLSRPLDFAAVTDHAEYLGVARYQAEQSGEEEFELRRIMRSGSRVWITWHYVTNVFNKMASPESREETFGVAGLDDVSRTAWNAIRAAAERHNIPGRFTSFVAYEWTSMPNSENLHRNVVYRSSASPDYPFTSLDSENPEDLWDALDAQRREGMDSFAIPHNGNVSNGLMYADVLFDGSAMTSAYAEQRMRNEPISEIFQIKGQSETHPVLSSADEFASFDLYDAVMSTEGRPSQPKGSYVRDALRTGLELSTREGFNPYRFGVIGSSDSHNASSSVEEDNHHGKLPLMDGTAALRLELATLIPKGRAPVGSWGSAGLAAVWASENTRDALFDAMQKKETYATSGPRISVRFFGGWNFDEAIFERPDFLERAYAQGVPMGGDLGPPETATSGPTFLVVASKDPLGANLDRIQIVKGWVDDEGRSVERIFDVAASDGRVVDERTRRAPPLESTVDVRNASYTNSVGATTLQTRWQDPDFDPDHEAFYYVRALEIETPRYSTYDAKLLGVEAPEPATHHERAVTSAIWFRP